MRSAIFPRRPGLAAVALGIVVFAALAFADRSFLGASLYETGDPAANSLLVQDAKHLALLHGNYSRLGFNHPGPAILYVLAAGELVFHDWLGLVRSPIMGQVLAICAYTAIWAALLAAVLARTFRSSWIGIAATATFLAVVLWREPQYLVGAWFPYLYLMPFAVYTASIARLAAGGVDDLVPLVLAGAFLVHGHASFVAIAGVMLAGALAAHALAIADLRRRGLVAYAGEAYRANRRAMLACAAIVLLFALPIALDAVLHFPGEIPKYLAYGRASRGNDWPAALAFLGYFWGGDGATTLPLLAGSAAIGALAFAPDSRGLAVALALATLATGLYAKTGIDDLSFKYTGLFYFAVVALVAAGIAAVTLTWLEPRVGSAPAIFAIAALALAATRVPPGPAENDPEIPAVYAELMRLERRPAVLDLDQRFQFGHVWGLVVGVANHAKRVGERALCVRDWWHILFTRALQCTPEDIARGTRFIVTGEAFAGKPPDGSFTRSDIVFVPEGVVPRLERGTPLVFNLDNASRASTRTGDGWASPERDYTWSVGASSRIRVRVDEARAFRLVLEIGAFVPRPDLPQEVEVIANGRSLARFDFTAERNFAARTVDVPAGVVGRQGTLLLEFRVARPLSPQSIGYSPDPRPLGVLLRSVTLVPAAS